MMYIVKLNKQYNKNIAEEKQFPLYHSEFLAKPL